MNRFFVPILKWQSKATTVCAILSKWGIFPVNYFSDFLVFGSDTCDCILEKNTYFKVVELFKCVENIVF